MTELTLHNPEATMAMGQKLAPYLQAGFVKIIVNNYMSVLL